MRSKSNFETRWANFVESRARRLRTTTEEAAKPVASTYLAALKEKAERLGISLDDAKRIRPGFNSYPTPDCIMPSELAEFMGGDELSESSIRHLGGCPTCCALIDMAGPSEDRLKSLLEEVRISLGERAVRSETNLAQLFEVVETH